jgi:NAD(P)-dependent dehydrogenase (short-subunit alcohol dehydrogenase family)
MQNILVIGAAGDVGQGLVKQFLRAGHRVLACGRNAERLDALKQRLSHSLLDVVQGSVGDEPAAASLRDEALRRLGNLDAVVTAVNGPSRHKPIAEVGVEEFSALFNNNVLPHLIAARAFIPAIRADGLYLGIGGGLADLLVPRFGHVGVCQAAQRRLFLALAGELGTRVRVRELMIYSVVSGESNRAKARAEWLTDDEVGQHAVRVFEQAEQFAEPIIKLSSRDQLRIDS